jgi:hypothetical protein
LVGWVEVRVDSHEEREELRWGGGVDRNGRLEAAGWVMSWREMFAVEWRSPSTYT